MRSINWWWIFWTSLVSSLVLFFVAHFYIAVVYGKIGIEVLTPFTAAIAFLSGIYVGAKIVDTQGREREERLNGVIKELRETREAFNVYGRF